jgi:hypothetical protein
MTGYILTMKDTKKNRHELLTIIVDSICGVDEDGNPSPLKILPKYMDKEELEQWKISWLANQISDEYPEDHEDDEEWAENILLEYFKDDIDAGLKYFDEQS